MKHLILRSLTALVFLLAFSHCSKETGERLSDGGDDSEFPSGSDDDAKPEDGRPNLAGDEKPNRKPGGGKSVAYCGYQFDGAESSDFRRDIEGCWIESSGNTCTNRKDATGEYCTKSGFEFDMNRSAFGEILFKYKSVLDVALKRTFDITTPTYTSIKFSSPLTGNYEGYRVVQLEGGKGFTRCVTFALRYDERDKRLYYTTPISHSGSTTESVPNLADYLKEHRAPEQMYRVRFE